MEVEIITPPEPSDTSSEQVSAAQKDIEAEVAAFLNASTSDDPENNVQSYFSFLSTIIEMAKSDPTQQARESVEAVLHSPLILEKARTIVDAVLSKKKEQYLTGTITAAEFFTFLTDLDQRDPQHTASEAIYRALTEEETIEHLIAKEKEFQENTPQSPEQQSPTAEYFDVLGLTLIHVMQKLAFEGNSQQAKKFFHSEFRQHQRQLEQYSPPEWFAYLAGTAAYLEEDLDQVHTAIQRIESIASSSTDSVDQLSNLAILYRFKQRLAAGQKPEYILDYTGAEK